jgi:MFS superfamily sulfate permease-like transporter
LENVPACVLAAVMIVVAAGIIIRAHFDSASMGK